MAGRMFGWGDVDFGGGLGGRGWNGVEGGQVGGFLRLSGTAGGVGGAMAIAVGLSTCALLRFLRFLRWAVCTLRIHHPSQRSIIISPAAVPTLHLTPTFPRFYYLVFPVH